LKDLKAEIERIQQLLERSRERMQADFEKWLSVMIKQNTYGSSFTSSKNGNAVSLDKKTNENLNAFYKARNEIYQT